jgi:ribosome-binding factor A
MADYRLQKVSQLLTEQLGIMITQAEIKDPRVSSLVSVSRVELSRDMAYAKVYVSSFESHQKLSDAVDGLNHAAGFIQGSIARRMRLRNTPRLTFIGDHGIEESFYINEKIKEALS